MTLIRTPQIADPDGFYEELVDAQRDLADVDAQKLLAKLVLLLANHVGERAALGQALAAARESVLHGGASMHTSVPHTTPESKD